MSDDGEEMPDPALVRLPSAARGRTPGWLHALTLSSLSVFLWKFDDLSSLSLSLSLSLSVSCELPRLTVAATLCVWARHYWCPVVLRRSAHSLAARQRTGAGARRVPQLPEPVLAAC
eukprot:COSAG06_NODE_2911_length_6102_cov_2.217724_5_plen_117_part_00